MHDSETKRPLRARRAVVLLALAGLAVAAIAMFPSGASAGAQPISLTVNVTGSGDGSIDGTADTSDGTVQISCQKNGGIILGCGQMSLADNEGQVVVSLGVSPGANSDFNGWTVSGGSGFYTDGCDFQIYCSITIYEAGAAVSVSASFTAGVQPGGLPLTVQRTGAARTSGSVFSSPAGISCTSSVQNPDCVALFSNGTLVTLTATAVGGATFGGWGGACASAGQSPTCQVLMIQAQTVTAAFKESAAWSVTPSRASTATAGRTRAAPRTSPRGRTSSSPRRPAPECCSPAGTAAAASAPAPARSP